MRGFWFLAFLLAVCDELQDWDRIGFASWLDEPKMTISTDEVKLGARDDGKITFAIVTEEEFNKKKEAFFNRRFGKDWMEYLVIGETSTN